MEILFAICMFFGLLASGDYIINHKRWEECEKDCTKCRKPENKCQVTNEEEIPNDQPK